MRTSRRHIRWLPDGPVHTRQVPGIVAYYRIRPTTPVTRVTIDGVRVPAVGHAAYAVDVLGRTTLRRGRRFVPTVGVAGRHRKGPMVERDVNCFASVGGVRVLANVVTCGVAVVSEWDTVDCGVGVDELVGVHDVLALVVATRRLV